MDNYHFPTVANSHILECCGFRAYNAKLWVGGYHMGVDISAAKNSDIYAVADGEVVEAGYSTQGGYGRRVVIQHDGFSSLYAHLIDVNVSAGDTVKAGKVIGSMGGDPDDDVPDGVSLGVHLHFEIILSYETPNCVKTSRGYAVDGIKFLKEKFLPAATHHASVKSSIGMNVRPHPSARNIAGYEKIDTMQYRYEFDVVELADDLDGTPNTTWARVRSLREEWVAVEYDGVKYVELVALDNTPIPDEEPEIEVWDRITFTVNADGSYETNKT